MNPKILVAILVVLGLLFFCGVGLGATVNGEHPGTPAPLGLPGEDLFRRLTEKPLKAEEINVSPAGCLGTGTVTPTPAVVCVVAIPTSGTSVRKLWLQLAPTPGTGATVSLVQPGSVTANVNVNGAHRRADLDIFKEGGTLTITCSGGPCLLNMVTPTPRP